MSQIKRETIIADFSAPEPEPLPKGKKLKGKKLPPPPSVMLISLKAGALGLK